MANELLTDGRPRRAQPYRGLRRRTARRRPPADPGGRAGPDRGQGRHRVRAVAGGRPSRVSGDRDEAIELAERAIAANLVHGDGSADFARALLAELLFEEGRETEAFAQLEPLRALMTVDRQAGLMVAEALELSGRAELAVEWLTEALETAITVGEAIPEEQEEARDHAAAVIYELATKRHELRGSLGLEHDDHDRLADELEEAVADAFEPGPLLFWPEAEYAELLRRWPYETETFTPSWDIHRTMVETELQAWANSGHTGLSVIPGTVADLVALTERTGVTVVDEDVQLDYLDELVEQSDVADAAVAAAAQRPVLVRVGREVQEVLPPASSRLRLTPGQNR